MPDPVLSARLGKAFRLFHVNCLVDRELTIEVGSLDVDLMYIPVVDSGQVQDEPQRFHTGGGGCGLDIVLTKDLLEATRNKAGLELYWVTMLVTF